MTQIRDRGDTAAQTIDMTSVEIRVHGIGNHHDWSELGSPQLIVDGSPRGPDTAVPPTLPTHQLRLVNWARTSRSRVGWLWYLALPYTLVNAAGYMSRPRDDNSTAQRRVRFTSVATGLILSVLTYLWLVAMVETIARRSFLPVTSSPSAGILIALVVGSLMVIGMVGRRTRPDAKTATKILVLNIAVVALVTTATLVFRPAHRQILWDWVPTFLTTYGPSATYIRTPEGKEPPPFRDMIANGQLVPYMDALVCASLAALAITFVLALAVVVRGSIEKVRGGSSTPAFGAAIALMSSVVLMISVSSAVRLFLDNIVGYLSRRDLLPLGDPNTVAPYSARVLLPPLNVLYTERNDWLMDLLPLLGVVSAIALLMGILIANLKSTGAGKPVLKLSERRARKRPDVALAAAKWNRSLVLCLPATLGPAIVVAFVLWAMATVAGAAAILTGPVRAWDWAVVTVQGVSVLAVFLIVAGRRFEDAAKPFGMVADLLGFWPIASHPLAGASYRTPVVEGIKRELATQARIRVLVGHSQGSVLCAWAVSELDESLKVEQRVNLVTCGSPLSSLYAVFFPADFNAKFFSKVHNNTAVWANFWRATDPIATQVLGVHNGNDFEIADPDPHGRLHVHGDYWIAPKQQTYIACRIAGC